VKKKQEKPPLVKFCEEHKGKQVFVGGMWTGDFIGTILSHGRTSMNVRVEKPINGDTPKPGETFEFPLGKYLLVRDPTDTERQIALGELYGHIDIG
jgi:hypothetical protein